MFDISMDEFGKTYSAPDLVKDKSEAEIGNARKRKYFCVTCVGVKHPVSLKTRRTFDHIDKKMRNYTALAWFSHHGGGGPGNSDHENHCPETARHWQAKHILCEHAALFCFVSSKCATCEKHTTIENGMGATGKVEFTETTAGGGKYVFDVVLMRGKPGSLVISSVLEVWATHETSDKKRQYCLDQGYSFAEFHADHVLEAYSTAKKNSVCKLKNLKIRCFECEECAHARRQLEIANEKAELAAAEAAEKVRVARLLQKKRAEEQERRAANDREFYRTTCAGAETRILQLQDKLYEIFALQGFRDSVKSKTAHQIPLDVYEYEEDDILRIGHPTGWRNFHTQKARDRELVSDTNIANGTLRLNTAVYEKGVSFKCICNKWVHPLHSRIKEPYPGIQRDGCVDVYQEQVHPTHFESIVEDGVRQHDSHSDNPYIKLCGLCANVCIFCEKGILQTQASGYGCCYQCHFNVPRNIERMQNQKRAAVVFEINLLRQEIVEIHAGNAFRGFSDFAIEHSRRQQEIANKQKLQQAFDDAE
jgi:hypothetical protein